jgi:hypothetical protein
MPQLRQLMMPSRGMALVEAELARSRSYFKLLQILLISVSLLHTIMYVLPQE